MANNIAQVADILIAEAAPVLREAAQTARRVTTEWRNVAAQKNQSINIPISSAKAVNAITDAKSLPTASDVAPFTVDVRLDTWEMTSFELTDHEQMELKPGIFPGEAAEALRALVNSVDIKILDTALASPFYAKQTGGGISWVDITLLHKVLFDNLVPLMPGDVSVFVNGTAQAQMLQLQEFIHADKSGETQGLIQAALGRRLNLDWFANQNIQTHTNGDLATGVLEGGGDPVDPVVNEEQTISYGASAGDPNIGDILNIAGSGAHAVTAVTAGSNVATIRPALRAQCADQATITYPADLLKEITYGVNYAFHRRAIAFASRPLQSVEAPGTIIRTVGDPLSGISVRLEIRRVGKTNSFEWDILYGAKLVRPELTARWADE